MNKETHELDYAYPIAPGDVPYWQPGMTLRDYFAGQAIIGMISTAAAPCMTTLAGTEEAMAVAAYRLADAMMAARKQLDE